MTIAEEYEAERERLERNRAFDWSTFGMVYKAAGEELADMTVQTWFDLLAINSPFLRNRRPSAEGVIDYIWRNSKRHTENKWLREWRLFWLDRRVKKQMRENEKDLVEVVQKHAATQIDEFPTESSQASGRQRNTMSTVAGEAAMIDEIANRYAMHPDEVLALPLRKAFALQRTIRVSTIPDYKLLEPDSLRAIKSKYLNRLNNGAERN